MSKYLSTASSHSGIDILDLISLLQGSSVRTELSSHKQTTRIPSATSHSRLFHRYHRQTYSSLGKFVHSLLRAGTTSLEHIKETSLVRRKTDDLGDKLSDHLGSLGGDL